MIKESKMLDIPIAAYPSLEIHAVQNTKAMRLCPLHRIPGWYILRSKASGQTKRWKLLLKYRRLGRSSPSTFCLSSLQAAAFGQYMNRLYAVNTPKSKLDKMVAIQRGKHLEE